MNKHVSHIDSWDRWLLTSFFFLIPLENVLEFFFDITTIFKPYRVLIIICILRAIILRDKHLLMYHNRVKYVFLMYFVGTVVFVVRMFFFDVSFFTFANDMAQIVLLVLFTNLYINKFMSEKDTFFFILSFSLGLLTNFALFYLDIESAYNNERFSGFYSNPNSLGLACSITIVIAIIFLENFNKFSHKFFWIIVIITSSIMLNETASRTSVISAFIAISIIVILKFSKRRVFIAFLGFLVFYFSSYQFDLSNIKAIKRQNVKDELKIENPRSKLFEAGLLSVGDTWGLGLGYGQFNYYPNFSKYMKPISKEILKEREKEKSGLGLHSSFTSTAVHGGFIALFLYILFNVKLIQSVYLTFLKSNKSTPTTIAVVLLIPTLIYSIFNDIFLSPIYWGMVILIEQLITDSSFVRNNRYN